MVKKPVRSQVVSLNRELDERNNIMNLCRKVVRFTRWQHHWPTCGDLYRKYNKGPGQFSLGAIQYYVEQAITLGWLERLPTSAVRLTPAYYAETNTTVLEPEFSSSAGTRAQQKTHLAKVWQAARKLKKAGLWPEEDEYDRYRSANAEPDERKTDFGEDWGGDWRTSPIRRCPE